MMDHPIPLHPFADAGFDQQIGGALLEHAGADSLFYVLLAARFQHD